MNKQSTMSGLKFEKIEGVDKLFKKFKEGSLFEALK